MKIPTANVAVLMVVAVSIVMNGIVMNVVPRVVVAKRHFAIDVQSHVVGVKILIVRSVLVNVLPVTTNTVQSAKNPAPNVEIVYV